MAHVNDASGNTPARLPWGVAALLLATSDAMAARFGAVVVRGELSGYNRAASGHCYFALKDAEGAPALLRCAMFRRAAPSSTLRQPMASRSSCAAAWGFTRHAASCR